MCVFSNFHLFMTIFLQIYILLYKEVALALKINSVYSKRRLLSIHENVRVLRYPDHFSSGVYLWYDTVDSSNIFSFLFIFLDLVVDNCTSHNWIEKLTGRTLISTSACLCRSHHEKLVIVDHQVCFIGGLDLCFGRYDTFEHKVGDNPSETWPGKDYYNPR